MTELRFLTLLNQTQTFCLVNRESNLQPQTSSPVPHLWAPSQSKVDTPIICKNIPISFDIPSHSANGAGHDVATIDLGFRARPVVLFDPLGKKRTVHLSLPSYNGCLKEYIITWPFFIIVFWQCILYLWPLTTGLLLRICCSTSSGEISPKHPKCKYIDKYHQPPKPWKKKGFVYLKTQVTGYLP